MTTHGCVLAWCEAKNLARNADEGVTKPHSLGVTHELGLAVVKEYGKRIAVLSTHVLDPSDARLSRNVKRVLETLSALFKNPYRWVEFGG